MWQKYLSLAIIVLALVGGGFIVASNQKVDPAKQPELIITTELEIPWAGMGKRLVEAGVIDESKFGGLYSGREEAVSLVLEPSEDRVLVMDSSNADIVLNALWAFGLANKNPILEEGPMTDSRFGGADRFASTGGWTLAKGSAMNYYSGAAFVVLTNEQQALVEEVSKNVYRPCCDNSTFFPDCNHGMAMLGLLEILAANGANEAELYAAAANANRLWFMGQYEVLDEYARINNIVLTNKDLVSRRYMSGSGFRAVAEAVGPATGGASCSV